MQIEKQELIAAAARSGISEGEAERLWDLLEVKADSADSKLDLSPVLYYFGAGIVILSMGWFLNTAWERYGSGSILAITSAYMLFFFIVGALIRKKESMKVPGGLFVTIGVCLIPIVVYSFQKLTGLGAGEMPGEYKDFISWISGGWFFMEVATIVGGCIALAFVRFPFLTMPVYFSLWFLSMDVIPLFFTYPDRSDNLRYCVSLAFGIGLSVVAYIMDILCRKDFAFWGYLFGTFTFWAGLSLLDISSEAGRFVYCMINIGLILLSVILQRVVFLIFGAGGVLSYLISLFYRHFSDSALFPIALGLLGIFIIFSGVIYHKNRRKFDAFILDLLPAGIRIRLPKPRR